MAHPRWLSEQEQQLWRLLLSATRKIEREIDETLLSAGEVSSSEFAVLVTLSEAPAHSLRLRELRAELDWDSSRLSHLVTRMQRRGLVEKSKIDCDARGTAVGITGEGLRRLKRAAPEHVESVRRLVFDNVDERDAPALRRFLQRVLAEGTGREVSDS